MRKSELRKIYKEKRKDLSEEQINVFQNKIYEEIFKYDFSSIETIHVFLSIERHKEINTHPIIDFLLLNNKKVVVSKSNFKENTLSHFLFDRSTRLEVNHYGIPEPVNAVEIVVDKIDLVFVPMLISDKKNYRIGYGKGFYDRFLSECRNDVKTIGLNFFEPIDRIEDIHEFDVALDEIIYPN